MVLVPRALALLPTSAGGLAPPYLVEPCPFGQAIRARTPRRQGARSETEIYAKTFHQVFVSESGYVVNRYSTPAATNAPLQISPHSI